VRRRPDDHDAAKVPGARRTRQILNQSVDKQREPAIFNHMVESTPQHLDGVFRALSDATRRRMLQDLAGGERTVSELAQPFAMSLAAASKHIKALEAAGLIQREVRGRMHVCRLEPGPLASAHEWLLHYENFWTHRLDVLEHLLRAQDGPERPTSPSPSPSPNKGKRP